MAAYTAKDPGEYPQRWLTSRQFLGTGVYSIVTSTITVTITTYRVII